MTQQANHYFTEAIMATRNKRTCINDLQAAEKQLTPDEMAQVQGGGATSVSSGGATSTTTPTTSTSPTTTTSPTSAGELRTVDKASPKLNTNC